MPERKPIMELRVLLALILLGLTVLFRQRSNTSTRHAPVIKKIADPAVAHHALVENADDFSDRPLAPFLVALEKSRGRGESLASVPHLRAMLCVVREFQQVAVAEVRALPGSMRAKLAEWRRLRRLMALHGRMGELFLPLGDAARRRRDQSPGPCYDDGRRPYVDSLVDLRVPGASKDDSAGRRAVRDDELVNLVSEFLGAGMGTVVACVEWTLAHLVIDQKVQKKLRDEVKDGDGGAEVDSSNSESSRSLIRGMPYLNAVVLESLRMHPLVPFVQRHVQPDAAGARVLGVVGETTTSDLFVQFTVGDIGRDKKTWTDPDEFRPERFRPGGEAEDVGPLPGTKEIRMMPFGRGSGHDEHQVLLGRARA